MRYVWIASSQYRDMETDGRTTCKKLLKRLLDMIQLLKKKSGFTGECIGIFRVTREREKSRLLTIEETFYQLYPEREKNSDEA